MGILTAITGVFTTGIVGKIIDSISGAIDTRNKIKESELSAKLKLIKASTEAKVALMKAGVAGDIAWENTAQLNSGWKDEFWTIVFSIPYICCFVPFTTDFVREGFNAMSSIPEWYMGLSSVVIGSAFGVRGIAKFMNLKSGISLSNVEAVSGLLQQNLSNKEIKESVER